MIHFDQIHWKKLDFNIWDFSKVKHITPIEEAVALAAIKKFRLTNQLENGYEEEEEDKDDVLERLEESKEELEAELEHEHEIEAIMILDLEQILFI